MPGLNFVFKKNENVKINYNNIGNILRYDDRYFYKEIINNDRCYLSYSVYDGYPLSEISVLKNADTGRYKDFKVIMEGMIYNYSADVLQRKIINIINSDISGEKLKIEVQNFVNEADGDYVICIVNTKTNEFIIFNDKYSRLPLFYYSDKDLIIISRNINFVLELAPHIEMNKDALIEWLIFSYCLGEKTFFKHIFRTLVSRLFYYNHDKKEYEIVNIFEPNLSFGSSKIKDEDYYLKLAKELYLKSVERRVKKIEPMNYGSIVGISGGFDTRTVLAGIKKFNSNATGITLLLRTGDGSEYAYKIAELFNTEIVRIGAENIRITNSDILREAEKIIRMIRSFEHIYDAYSNFLLSKEIKNRFPMYAVLFGGFGGEWLRHPYKPKRWQRDIRDFLWNWQNDIYLTSNITKISEKNIYEYLENEVRNLYGTSDLSILSKLLYFNYYNGYVLSGEDRARIHFWTIQPMSSIELIDFYTSIFPIEFASYSFFTKFMISIDERTRLVPTNHFRECPNPNQVNIILSLRDIVRNSKITSKIVAYFLKRPFSRGIRNKLGIYKENPYGLSNEEISLMNEEINRIFTEQNYIFGPINLQNSSISYKMKLLTIGAQLIDERYYKGGQ